MITGLTKAGYHAPVYAADYTKVKYHAPASKYAAEHLQKIAKEYSDDLQAMTSYYKAGHSKSAGFETHMDRVSKKIRECMS